MKITIEVINDHEKGIRKITVKPEGFQDTQQVIATLAMAQHDYISKANDRGADKAMEFASKLIGEKTVDLNKQTV